jgi:3-(3-hydroxy-phenyl)propionate hydroxylase
MTARVFRQFAYRPSPDQTADRTADHRVAIIGAGPVGLSLAIDLAQRGVTPVVLDDSDRIGDGSRAICFAKATLEIFDRLGVGDPIIEKGVVWQRGKVFRGRSADPLYQFDLLPEDGHRRPAFVNIQQFYVEAALVDRAAALGVDLRWKNRVSAITPANDHARLTVDTPDGPYVIAADWVIACDGARSPARGMMGLDFGGEVFEDQFLIADVKMTAPFPTERWFWFDPPFHDGQSALLHRQPDDIWRIDLQLSADADAEHERRPQVVRPRIARMLGHDDFALDWISIYRFQCRRLDRFVHGRVIFAGDAAHQVSPFGARGANSGIQDALNLGWKLAAVIAGDAPAALIESYEQERSEAADENILNSTRATDFLAPRSPAERILRDAVLDLAAHAPFARAMVNSGRLSRPTAYSASPLSTPDEDAWVNGSSPGAPIPDAPVGGGFVLDRLGPGFSWIGTGTPPALPPEITPITLPATAAVALDRFDLRAGGGYLVRPDGHVAARFRTPTADLIAAARDRAMALAVGA